MDAVSFENPGDGTRCDHCNVVGIKYDTLTPNRGECLCRTCLDRDVAKDVHAFTHDPTTGLAWVTPRWHGRG